MRLSEWKRKEIEQTNALCIWCTDVQQQLEELEFRVSSLENWYTSLARKIEEKKR